MLFAVLIRWKIPHLTAPTSLCRSFVKARRADIRAK
ncbi:MAG: hypothetical protein ACJAZV_001802, partial [Roseivirga sp.]